MIGVIWLMAMSPVVQELQKRTRHEWKVAHAD